MKKDTTPQKANFGGISAPEVKFIDALAVVAKELYRELPPTIRVGKELYNIVPMSGVLRIEYLSDFTAKSQIDIKREDIQARIRIASVNVKPLERAIKEIESVIVRKSNELESKENVQDKAPTIIEQIKALKVDIDEAKADLAESEAKLAEALATIKQAEKEEAELETPPQIEIHEYPL